MCEIQQANIHQLVFFI